LYGVTVKADPTTPKRGTRKRRGSKLEGDALAEVLIDADGALDGVLDRLGWSSTKLLRALEKDVKALERALAELEERGIDADHERLRWIRPVLQLHANMEDDDDWVRYRQLVLEELTERPERSAESEAVLRQAVARTDALLEQLKAQKPKKPAPSTEVTEFYED
jgi:Asp-tRNA(Asn)/Glu-tRNA(Gln) amidotransferase A subunit family amidase